MAKSYRDYEIWQMAHELAVRVHRMTLENCRNLKSMRKGVKSVAPRNRFQATL